MADWNSREHMINAALWAIIGSYVSDMPLFAQIPPMVRLGALAMVYSYAADQIEGMIKSSA
jgi:hypothetical protein